MNAVKMSYPLRRLLLNLAKRGSESKIFTAKFNYASNLASKWDTNIYSNPLKELQPLVQIPLTNIVEDIFKPREQDIDEAHQMFQPRKGDAIVYKAEVRPEMLPELNIPEV